MTRTAKEYYPCVRKASEADQKVTTCAEDRKMEPTIFRIALGVLLGIKIVV